MPFFVSTVDSILNVQGPIQQFNFNSSQSDAIFKNSTLFEPTSPSIPSNLKFDLINHASKGYRSGILTKSDNSKPIYLISFVEPSGDDENATITSTPLLTFNEDQDDEFKFYKKVQGIDPTDNNHLTTKSWVLAQISGAIPPTGTVTLGGDVTGTGLLGSTITTTLAKRLDQITAPTSAVSFNSQKITDVATPTNATEGANKSYIDGKTWPSSAITDFSSSVNTLITATRLDQLAVPTADLNLNLRKITGLANSSSGTDAVNRTSMISYVAGQTIGITGDIVGALTPIGGNSISTTLSSGLTASLATKSYVNAAIAGLPAFSSGTFTPVICDIDGHDVIGDAGYGGKGYIERLGVYYKIGQMVFIQLNIFFAGNSYGSDSTALYLKGLPFSSSFAGVTNVPISYVNCGANNILQLYMQLNDYNTIHPIISLYQSLNQSIDNPFQYFTRGTINKFNDNSSYITMNFSYSTSS